MLCADVPRTIPLITPPTPPPHDVSYCDVRSVGLLPLVTYIADRILVPLGDVVYRIAFRVCCHVSPSFLPYTHHSSGNDPSSSLYRVRVSSLGVRMSDISSVCGLDRSDVAASPCQFSTSSRSRLAL